jgi:hypothetical protein
MAVYSSVQKQVAENLRERLERELEREMLNRQPAPPQYSIASIVFNDGTTQEFMVKASPSVVPHLVKEMKATGYLTLWNDSDTLCVAAHHIKHFALREITKE